MRRRSLRGVCLFTGIAYLYFWPIFFVVDAWLAPRFFAREQFGAGVLTALFGNMLAMAGPGIAALIVSRMFDRKPMPRWRWGRLRYYALAAAAMLALWTVPGLVELAAVHTIHLRTPIEPFAWVVVGASLSVGWLAGLGEETGWSAYLLPRLAPEIGKSRALVVSGAIRGLWHWPVLVAGLLLMRVAREEGANLWTLAPTVSACSTTRTERLDR